jgi:hypothetical protein
VLLSQSNFVNRETGFSGLLPMLESDWRFPDVPLLTDVVSSVLRFFSSPLATSGASMVSTEGRPWQILGIDFVDVFVHPNDDYWLRTTTIQFKLIAKQQLHARLSRVILYALWLPNRSSGNSHAAV